MILTPLPRLFACASRLHACSIHSTCCLFLSTSFFRTLQKLFFSTSSSDNTHLIINAVGLDRLGIVSDVTGMVIESGGNVGDSQAAKLGSHFSLMMVVTLPRDRIDTLKGQLEAMPDMNAAIFEDHAHDVSATPQIGCKLFLWWWSMSWQSLSKDANH